MLGGTSSKTCVTSQACNMDCYVGGFLYRPCLSHQDVGSFPRSIIVGRLVLLLRSKLRRLTCPQISPVPLTLLAPLFFHSSLTLQFGGMSHSGTSASYSWAMKRLPTPREMVRQLDRWVIGQPQAKRVSEGMSQASLSVSLPISQSS